MPFKLLEILGIERACLQEHHVQQLVFQLFITNKHIFALALEHKKSASREGAFPFEKYAIEMR